LDDISDAGVADRLAHMDFNPDNYVGETGLEGRLLFGTALIPSVKSYVEALTPVERGPYPSNVASEVTRAQVGYGAVHMQPHVQAGRVIKSVGYAMSLTRLPPPPPPSFSPTLSPNTARAPQLVQVDLMVEHQRAELRRGRQAAVGGPRLTKVEREQRRSPSAMPVPTVHPPAADMEGPVAAAGPPSLAEAIGLKPIARPRKILIRALSPQELSEKAAEDAETAALFPDPPPGRRRPSQRPRATDDDIDGDADDDDTDATSDDPLDDLERLPVDDHLYGGARRVSTLRTPQKEPNGGPSERAVAAAVDDHVSPSDSADVDAYEEDLSASRRRSSAALGVSGKAGKSGKGKPAAAAEGKKAFNEEQYFKLWRKRPSVEGL